MQDRVIIRQNQIRRLPQVGQSSGAVCDRPAKVAAAGRNIRFALLAISGLLVAATLGQEQVFPRPDLALITSRPPVPMPQVDPSNATATPSALDCTPPRQMKGLTLTKLGWTYNCMECHKLLPARWHYDRPMAEHGSIKLDHGNNRFCLNCHHPSNRSAFVDYDGSEIAEADVVLLCAKCHGPTYRDWQAGVHGRRNGYWNVAKGARTQLRCIQCHDPHQPKFKELKPLPPLQYPARAAGAPVAHVRSSQRAQSR